MDLDAPVVALDHARHPKPAQSGLARLGGAVGRAHQAENPALVGFWNVVGFYRSSRARRTGGNEGGRAQLAEATRRERRGERSAGRARNRQGDAGDFCTRGGILDEIFMASGTDAAPARFSAVRAEAALPEMTMRRHLCHLARLTMRAATASRRGSRCWRASYGIDPAEVVGTGRDGRVTRMDIGCGVGAEPEDGRDKPPSSVSIPTSPRSGHAPAIRSLHRSHIVAHTPMRLSIARHMLDRLRPPHVTAIFEADFTAIIKHREKSKSGICRRRHQSFLYGRISSPPASRRCGLCRRSTAAGMTIIWRSSATSISASAWRLATKAWSFQSFGSAGPLAGCDCRQTSGSDQSWARPAASPTPICAAAPSRSQTTGCRGSLVAAPIIINQPQSAILRASAKWKSALSCEKSMASIRSRSDRWPASR